MIKDGKWLEPRYTDKAVFEKDYGKMGLLDVEVKCPGCKRPVTLNHKNAGGKSAGWCRQCNRAVTL